MSLYITSLNSGSNGNCYYVGNDTEAILIDAGISCREIEKRMKRLGLCIQKVKAIFISHEHTDHIRGLAGVCKKFKFPVYITNATLSNSRCLLDENLVVNFSADQPITFGSLSLTAFPKLHDASDPYSFTVTCGDVKVGVFTDIGFACKNVVEHFKHCNAAFLEANYDEEMLKNSTYPYYLKKRISGGNGHLSNTEALQLFKKHRPKFMSHIFLSHLSQNNNCPKLVKDLFAQHAGGVEVVVASRFEETPVYHISAGKKPLISLSRQAPAPQLSFAFA